MTSTLQPGKWLDLTALRWLHDRQQRKKKMSVPDWLYNHLRSSSTPRDATNGLVFHGTVEPFKGGLKASNWERLCWFAEAPEIAQSYCPESGSDVLKGFASYSLNDHFVPHSSFDETIFAAMGFDVAQMEAERDRYGRMSSYRILKNHPTNREALSFLEGLGYIFEGESCWIKVRIGPNGNDEIMPASWMIPGRLFIAKRPQNLRLYDLQSTEDGGLTGRQWMRTDLFEKLADSGEWDGIIIDDIHQTKKLGHFSHRSIGLFQPTINALQTHIINCVHQDPYNVWNANDGSTTPEFDQLWTQQKTTHKQAA